MKRTRRKGATETFSVSVDHDTKEILKAAAVRDHGGNVSSLITELAREAARRKAAGDFLRSRGILKMTEAQAVAFEKEIEAELTADGHSKKRRRKRRAA